MRLLILAFLLFMVISCADERHFISDKNYLHEVVKDFEKTVDLAVERDSALFYVLNKDLTLEEKEALMFLYAYMPLNDLADYDANYFLRNVRYALKARDYFSWGDEIPEDIFRHFVLPYRVNNENLDSSRVVFFNELSDRLAGLNLTEAILEVNHWCHEKVTYQPTDIRTISPLGAIKSAYGRCGEESTFTVSALRAAAIPARQCYTPRWAHADDNHAWVEVWVNGSWHYLGACEPEPELDMAWFSGPAMRAMLVNSNAFGKYSGPEEIIRAEEKYTKINMLENYAPVKTIYVRTLDSLGRIENNATVEFQLYNYAEFYPIAKKTVDKDGIASLMTGFGDLLVWAYSDNLFGYQKITVETTDTLEITLKTNLEYEYSDEYDIIPPIVKEPKQVPVEGIEANKTRLKEEDEIRQAYVKSFMTENKAFELADRLSLPKDQTWNYIQRSRGNWQEIESYLIDGVELNHKHTLTLLEIISAKDLRDSKSQVLLSHLFHSFTYTGLLPESNQKIFHDYVLNPRIANEKLIGYKPYLQKVFGEEFISATRNDIKVLLNWIEENIRINPTANYYNVPITAQGVYDLKVSDSFSRDIFFVAACRSFGIPARLEPATKIPQYFDEEWHNVIFEAEKKNMSEKLGLLLLQNSEANTLEPSYRIHFTISRFENGKYHTLEYGWEKPLSQLSTPLELPTGHYMLITGNRKPDGSVLTKMDFFTINAGEEINQEIRLRESNEPLISLGKISMDNDLETIHGESYTPSESKFKVFGWIDPDKEPTKHTLKDIEKLKTYFESRDIEFILLINPTSLTEAFDQELYELPKLTSYVLDEEFRFLNTLVEIIDNNVSSDLPVFVLSKNNQVYFLSTGYRIGLGESILKLVSKLE